MTHEVQESPLDAFKGALKLFCTRDMLLLSVTFIYTGELHNIKQSVPQEIGVLASYVNCPVLIGDFPVVKQSSGKFTSYYERVLKPT